MVEERQSVIATRPPQMERARTAVVRPTILDADRLNQMGVDMSQWRCKDINRPEAFVLPHVLSQYNRAHHAKRNNGRLAALPCIAVSPVATVPSNPCKSCQRSGGVPERFHTHANHAEDKLVVREPEPKSCLEKLRMTLSWPKTNHRMFGTHKSKEHNSSSEIYSRTEKRAYIRDSRSMEVISPAPSTSSSESCTSYLSRQSLPKVYPKKASYKKSSSTNQPFLTCQICGRQFGSASIKIHQPQCYQKKMRESVAHQTEERREDWPSTQSRQGSASSFSSQRKLPLKEQHFQNQVEPAVKNSETPERMPQRGTFRPIACFICGREFGTRSIAIHQPQCLQKWHWNNDKLPRHLRKEPPTPP